KFSTLTKPDLVSAYENKADTINWGQAEAGLARHELDWYWGINTSRALTSAIKTAGMFKVLSAGRVQGPTLKIIVEKENEIKAFKSEPYWQIQLLGDIRKGSIEAWHKEDKFFDKKKADGVMQKISGKKAFVEKIKKTQNKQNPPAPFDLTTLQTEAYRCFRISPNDALAIAQNLYVEGLISYPRTSSQKLPPVIGYKKILQQIGKQKEYSELVNSLLNKPKLAPNEGKKTDPAHPAIYPTGIQKKLEGKNEKIYDLIVRRFLATFAESALRETAVIEVNVNGEIFVANGTRTVEKGWHVFYGKYVPFKEKEMPDADEGEEVSIKNINLLDKKTQPPPRYTPASIIKELEKRNLGTKSTRAQIIETLYQRSYVKGESLEATDLGINTVETLQKYCPEIVDEELTREFELEMEQIREGKKKKESILEKARTILKKILAQFRKKEKGIGEELQEATRETQTEMNTIGKCPNCETGTLMMRRGKFGRFIACSNYPECKTTFKLPANGLIKPSKDICKDCGHPMIVVIRKRKRPQEVCINLDCPSKKIDEALVQEKPCSKCNEGKLVLRKSLYGSFLACNRFPQCRHIEKIPQ
ncbi:MAG TPA: DNA topoisomerase I, partial [Candidatus Nanoarchaeia archaeon]|nr:DNA topoisomerase I [Candidatus Nanoarchaeia archaeon]